MSATTEYSSDMAEQVHAMLIEQRDLYRRLSRLADRQRNCITGNEPEKLLGILAERQQLIDALEGIARQLRPVQANWQQLRETLSAEQVVAIDAVLAEINTLLREILQQDEADTALLSARKTQTGRNIQTLQTGRQAGRAYAASAYGNQATGTDWSR